MEDEWKPISGFPGYEVSNYGRVRSFLRARGGILGSFISDKPQKILRPHQDNHNRLNVHLRKDGKRYRVFVHRLVLIAFIGPCPPGMEACHNDGNPTNNIPLNLRWDSHLNNLRDRAKHGTETKGERNGQARLTESDIIKIRKMAEQGISTKRLGEIYAVHYAHICGIIRGRYWAHL